MGMIESAFNVLIMVLGFGLLIFVHELGHFLAAKWAGIRVESFAIGFGPPVISWRGGIGLIWGSTDPVIRRRAGRSAMQMRDHELQEAQIGETEYSLRWLPLGGFVRMLGQDDLDPGSQSGDPRSFNSATIGRRMVVISAGVVMNVLLAVLCFIIAFSMGVRFEAPVVGEVVVDSPAAEAVPADPAHGVGLQSGDRIVQLDGDQTPTFADLQVITAMSVGDGPMSMRIERRGVDGLLSYELTPRHDPVTQTRSLGIYPASSTTLGSEGQLGRYVENLLERTGLDKAGVVPGAALESLGDTSVSSFHAIDLAMQASGGQPVASTWRVPDGKVVDAVLTADPQWQQLRYPDASSADLVGWEQGVVGLVPLVRLVEVMPGSINDGILQSGDVVLAVGDVVGPRMRAFRDAIAAASGSLPMVVLRGDQRVEVTARVAMEGVLDPKPKLQVLPGYAFDTPLLASPMREVELADGGTMVTAAGQVPDGLVPTSRVTRLGSRAIDSWRDIWMELHAATLAGNTTIEMTVELPIAASASRTVSLTLRESTVKELAALHWQSPIPELLFDPVYVTRSSGGNPIRALAMGAAETSNFVILTYLTIDRLFRGTLGVDQLRGPVGIVHLGTRVVDRGFTYLLFFLAIISVNLAVLNFLPLPIVDGGQFLYLIYEKVTGRLPSLAFQTGAMMLGLLLIGTLFVVTFYNDVARLVG
ncbi:MAG: site-2 protease family protein [Phycisphaerales bacterium]|nr:site-2 protease family protein [Phycisphaerales bacterium]